MDRMAHIDPTGYSRIDDRTISTRYYFIDVFKVGVHGRSGTVDQWSS